MKKSFVFAVALAGAYHFSFAQTTNTFPLDGNVGIGTTSPWAKLHVIGNVQFDGIYDGTNNVRFTPAGGSGNTWELYPQPQGYGLYNRTNNTFPFFVSNGDNVGIGTIEPENAESWQRVLEVKGYYHSKMLVSTDQINSGMWSHNSGFYGAPAGGITGTATNHPFSIITNKTARMVVNTAGNIGIGTSDPRAVFDVASNIANGKLGAVLGRLHEGNTVGDGTYLGIRGYNTDFSNGGKSFSLEHSFYGETNSSINFFRGGDRTGGFISFNTTSNIERMRIDHNGNIGIGTTTPNSKLAVNGNIRAHEIKVETANWPDYVFAKDYQLPTLQETEKHIKDKGHLPGIPSATEVKANGVDLGEMNTKLLQKIEELTLHLIEQNKMLKTQQNVLEVQQQEINALKLHRK